MADWNPAANDLFLQALEIAAPADRRGFLDGACGSDTGLRAQVESLLAASDRAGSFLDRPALDLAQTVEHSATVLATPAEEAGQSVGPYRLLHKLGEGGMGTVWAAEQGHPVRRCVALKLVKPGMDSARVVARFEAERQALALMDHTNIAKVLDAGTTPAGRPYFVMELVPGPPITAYCDEHRLSVRERLGLFADVCRAVQHAHQKGVIHRDLKPSNVLVAEQDGRPVPKVIDFGVAKALTAKLGEQTLHTEFGMIVGTLEYMAPEQAGVRAQDVDTRADVYALGVILYELLTGTTPLSRARVKGAPLAEVLRLIREEEPPKPSTRLSESRGTLADLAAVRRLRAEVRGELDWIAMKCLEKDRTRRYETVNGLARDVERYLADEPVTAGPPSVGYRFRKFARRNRVTLSVAALIFLAILTLTGSIGWGIRDRAAREAVALAKTESALSEAENHLRHERWSEAASAAKRAEALLAAGPDDATLRQRLLQLQTDLRMVARLDQIRLEGITRVWPFPDPRTHQAYASAFRAYGIDVEELVPAEAAARIQVSAIRGRLVTAVDDWLWTWEVNLSGHLKDAARLRTVIQLADAGEWRTRLHDPAVRKNRQALEALADSPEAAALPPSEVIKLAMYLSGTQADQKVFEVLTVALARHPQDFWLNFHLGGYSYAKRSRPEEAVGFFQAALATRSSSGGARTSRTRSRWTCRPCRSTSRKRSTRRPSSRP
jgi:serine/threonine protein kinase